MTNESNKATNPEAQADTTRSAVADEKPKKQRSWWRNLVLNALLIFCSSLFAVFLFLIIGEIWIRSQELPADSGSIYEIREDKLPLVVLKPGAQEISGGAPVRINQLGFRGKEYSLQKPPETLRLIALGDSFTFGAGAPEEVLFTTLLEKRLNEQLEKQVEVLNLGVSDYNTEDELARLTNLGLKLEPDTVLLFYVLNDIELKNEYLEAQQSESNPSQEESQPSITRKEDRAFRDTLYDAVVRLRKYSHFLAYLAPRIAALGRQLGFDLPSSGSDWSRMYAENVEGWQRSKKAMLEMKRLGEKNGFEFALVLFPLFTNLRGAYPALKSHEVIAQFSEENDIPFLDLLDVYKGINATSLWVSPTDGHPNTKGHKIAADAIYEFITKHPQLIKQDSSPWDDDISR